MGMSEYDVMKLTGHSSFETTHRFYLAIKSDYLNKARQANVGLGLQLGVGEQGHIDVFFLIFSCLTSPSYRCQ